MSNLSVKHSRGFSPAKLREQREGVCPGESQMRRKNETIVLPVLQLDDKMKWMVEAASNAALNSREVTVVNRCSNCEGTLCIEGCKRRKV